MKPTVIESVADILDTFNLDEITTLLHSQIAGNNEEIRSTHPVDHFKPLYYKYRCIIDTEENSGEIIEETKKRFEEICNIMIDLITKKFHLIVDEEWKEDNVDTLPGLVMALYSFFVLDLPSNLQEVCLNYIRKHEKDIYEMFEYKKNKKDASTMVNKRFMTPEMVVISSNIYDITTWILSTLSEESFISYINSDYAPLNVISTLLEDGKMTGEFMTEINDMYATNVDLKCNVCFELLALLKEGGN